MSTPTIPRPPAPAKQRAKPRGKPGVATGTVEWVRNRYVAKVSLKGTKKRERVELLDATGRPKYTDKLRDKKAAQVSAANISHGMRQATVAPALEVGVTVEAFGDLFTSNALLERYGEVCRLKEKKSVEDDKRRLKNFVYPTLGKMPIAAVTEEDVRTMFIEGFKAYEQRHFGRKPAQDTKIQVYAIAHRLFELSIQPAGLRTTNPVQKYMKPQKAKPKIYNFIYPQELLALLGCTRIPIERRVAYATAVYTFQRKESLKNFRWADIDLEHSTIVSLVNKTHPQLFAQKDSEMPGYESLIELLRKYREFRGWPSDGELVLTFPQHKHRKEASFLRRDLIQAGITRAILFSDDPNVSAVRFHDLRATGITWAKRIGKSDGWISDRSGHTTPAMIERYNRYARHLKDLQIEVFPDLSNAIPELRDINVTRLRRRPR